MITRHIRQKGFGLVDTLLSLIVLSVLALGVMKGALILAERNKAQAFAKHVEKVITSVQGYHYYRDSNRITMDPVQKWPASLDALVTDYNSRYWIACSIAEAQAGKCKRPEYTPFASKISYAVIDANTARLVIPTIRLGQQQSRWNSYLLQIPFAKKNASGDIEINIYPPMNSTVYNEFLRKDGTTKLTGTWDVGNQAITNIAGLSMNNTDNSQSVVSQVMSVEIVQHGTSINKPICPKLLKPAIQATLQGMYKVDDVYSLIGNSRVSIDEKSTYWTVYLQYAAKKKTADEFEIKTDGDISVVTYCLPIK